MSDGKKPDEVSEAAERMDETMSNETENALDRSLAVQGEREDGEPIGSDEEE